MYTLNTKEKQKKTAPGNKLNYTMIWPFTTSGQETQRDLFLQPQSLHRAGFNLPRHAQFLLNHYWTGQGSSHANVCTQGLAISAVCERDRQQTKNQIVNMSINEIYKETSQNCTTCNCGLSLHLQQTWARNPCPSPHARLLPVPWWADITYTALQDPTTPDRYQFACCDSPPQCPVKPACWQTWQTTAWLSNFKYIDYDHCTTYAGLLQP